MKRVWSGIFLSILLISFVNLALPVESVGARTIVVPDDYPTIQEAIISANDGDTIFVRNGTYYENVIVNKAVSLIGEDRSKTVLNSTFLMDYVSLEIVADNVIVTGFSLLGARTKISINSASNVTIKENIIEFTWIGINCSNSRNSKILNNSIRSLWRNSDGIFLNNCTGYLITNNTLTVGSEVGFVNCGMHLYHSSNNLISGNVINGYRFYGIILDCGNGSDGNMICKNEIMDSYYAAIWMEDGAGGNQISANFMSRNYLGIVFGINAKGNNTLFHNSFYENSGSVVLIPLAIDNEWSMNDEGNYWDDYNGMDSNEDGIGDVPYIINSNNIDNYPLMNVYWHPCDINLDLTINLKDIGVSATAFGSYPGHPRWNTRVDLDRNSKINLKDISLIARNFGETYS